MELRPTTWEIVPEDDEGLAYVFFRAGSSYLSISRFTDVVPEESSVIETERDDQAWSTKADPKSCELRTESLHLEYEGKASVDLGGTAKVTVFVPVQLVPMLRATLSAIFRGRSFYSDLT